LRYDDIHSKLNAIEKPSEQESSLMLIGEFTEAIKDQQAMIQALNNKIKKQDDHLDEIDQWLALPPLKRMFTKPPTRKDRD